MLGWVAPAAGAARVVDAAARVSQRQSGERVDERLIVPGCVPARPNVEEETVQA